MIALALDSAEEFAEAFYLSQATVDEFDGRLGTRRWHDLKGKERRRWIKAAERVMQLYPAEGLTMGISRTIAEPE
jgi:hypothetical protein